MYLTQLKVRGFRNLDPATIALSGGVNVFNGENAQGKTNIIESIHLLSNLTSFRTRRLKDMVQTGSEEGLIVGTVQEDVGETSLKVSLLKDGKNVWVDGSHPTSTAEYLKVFPTVFFGPGDMELAAGDQKLRRRYLDKAVFSVKLDHLENIKQYRRALLQRNNLLAKGSRDLDSWTHYLSIVGYDVFSSRREVMEDLKDEIKDIHHEISGGNESVEVDILPSWGGEEGPEKLREALENSIEEDLRRGYTLHGPHRDRIRVRLGGRDITEHGSQGQHRTLALAMKLSLLNWSRDRGGDIPAFLLDDPGSELDGRRLGFLGEFLDKWEGQIFIATVNRDDVPIKGVKDMEFHKVVGGKVFSTATDKA